MRFARNVVFAAGAFALIVMIGTLGQRTFQLLRMQTGLAEEQAIVEALIRDPPVHEIVNPEVLREALYDAVAPEDVSMSRERLFVMIGASDCHFCEAGWRAWNDAVPSTWLDQGLDVWYVSLDREYTLPVPLSRLRQRGARVRLLQVVDADEYSVRTGIQVMPMAFLFNGNMELACVVSGAPESNQTSDCADSPTAPETGPRRTLFDRTAQSYQLIDFGRANVAPDTTNSR